MKNRENPFEVNYCAVFEHSPGLFLLLSADPNFTILGVSKAYAKATMIEKERVVGKTLFQIFPDNPEDPAASGMTNLRDSLIRVLEFKVKDDMPVQKYDIKRPNGDFEVRYWTPSNSPVFNDKDQMIAIIHQVEDVTDFVQLKLKGLEQAKITAELRDKTNQMEYEIFGRQQELLAAKNELRSLNEGLEEKVKERTKELKKAIAARDEFLNIASHELKTPITSLKLQLQMTKRSLDKKEGPEKFDKAIDLSSRQVDRLTVLVEELLDIARVDSGKFHVTLEEFDITELVHQVVERMSGHVDFNETSIKESYGMPFMVTADRFRVDQVISNLLSNALKYGANNPIKVSVFQEGDFAKVVIKDQGIGIAKDKHEKIFDRFERAIGHQNISGLGLGLYISREILNAHKGKIEVQSTLGKGSCFTVCLPVKHPQ